METEIPDFAAVINAMAPLLGLEVTEEMRPGVELHLENTANIAAQFLLFPLEDEDEPAPAFVP